MKEMYVPTMDELYLMQDMGGNVYKYLVAKVIEKLILEGINTPAKGMLKSAYKYLKEDYDVASAVCTLYPEEMKYSEILRYDSSFCLKLIEEPKPLDRSLDNLSYFDTSAFNNIPVMNKTITRLNKVLLDNPKYRFTYKQSKLLDDIFLVRVNLDTIGYDEKILLASIEPAYLVKYFEYYSSLLKGTKTPDEVLKTSIFDYCHRYDIANWLGQKYRNKDILTNQPTEVKRLIKCINNK